MLKAPFFVIASAFALSACLGSGSGSSDQAPDEIPDEIPDETADPAENMPTEGAADYAGAVSFKGDGTTIFRGNMSMRATFNATGGTMSDGELGNISVVEPGSIQTATGSLTQDGTTDFTGTSFSGLPLTGEVTATVGGETATITSGGANTVLIDGQFQGDGAEQIGVTLGGAVSTSDGGRNELVGSGTLEQ